MKWISEEVEILRNLHLRGREAHQYELQEFTAGIAALHQHGSPTVTEYEMVETEEKITELAQTFLTNEYQKREDALPDTKYFRQAERMVTLRTIDQFWMDHIDDMAHLREQVALVGYAQKNPFMNIRQLDMRNLRHSSIKFRMRLFVPCSR